MANKAALLVLSVFCYMVCVLAVPKTGNIKQELKLMSTGASFTCVNIGLYNGSTISVEGNVAAAEDTLKGAVLKMKLILYRAECANGNEECNSCPDRGTLVAVSRRNISLDATNQFTFMLSNTVYLPNNISCLQATLFAIPPAVLSTDSTPSGNSTPTTATPNSTGIPTTSKPDSNVAMKMDQKGGVFIVQVISELFFKEPPKTNTSVNLTINFKLRNPHGYLSAVDFPALVFYGLLTGVYALFAIGWLIALALSYTDLIRLQFWVLGVILLGFVEKALFLAEYDSVNQGNEFHLLIVVAVLVSAVKRALSRMLLVIVALGYGTVKPRLGDSLGKVILLGVVYGILAAVNGVLRARNDTAHSNDTSAILSYALLIIVDLLIMYWIFASIVETRRALRIRKNFVKLSMYNHFTYALIFSILAALGFVIWDLFTYVFPPGCLKDWSEVWLHDCFWHVLFAIILVIIMCIWRPSANKSRFSYSLVDDEDDEDDNIEQGTNKNFESVKMRQVTGSTSEHPPPPFSQAEEDLKWVEENLPTSAIDRALPLILDSDEEVMTTKFEASKIN